MYPKFYQNKLEHCPYSYKLMNLPELSPRLYSEFGYVLVTKWNTKCVHVNE